MKHYITYKHNGVKKMVCAETLKDLIEYLEMIQEEPSVVLIGVVTK